MGTSFGGTGITIWDVITGGTLLLSFCGAILAVMGGCYAFRVKQLEFRIKTMELEEHKKKVIDKLHADSIFTI
jgi:hypothetical protein